MSNDEDVSKYDVEEVNFIVNVEDRSDSEVMFKIYVDGCVQIEDAYEDMQGLFVGVKSVGI